MIRNLSIETLAFGGSGVGRVDGKVIFVPFTAPGDVVDCRIVRERKRYAEGELVQVGTPSPERRTPPCPVFGECGGCQWQHLSYEVQSAWKSRIFGDILQRQCRLPSESLKSLAPAPREWGYRSRVQFKCRQTANGFVMGYYRRGSHFVVDVSHCPIAHPRLNEVLTYLRRHLPTIPFPERIPQVDLAVGDDGRVRAEIHLFGEGAETLMPILARLAMEGGFSCFFQTGRKETLRWVHGEEDLLLEVDHPPLQLAFGPGGFAQVNLEQNQALVAEVVRETQLSGRERVLDLFCGMGNFSLPLARRAAEVVGVEDYVPSIEKARHNARVNGVGNARFFARPAQGAAGEMGKGSVFDLVLLDPPRTGAYQVAKELVATAPGRILYVSCDPPTLARDLVPLLHGGYSVVWSRPFDLFPQTHHIESLTLLSRTG